MSYKSTLQAHNTDLQGILDAVNMLPDSPPKMKVAYTVSEMSTATRSFWFEEGMTWAELVASQYNVLYQYFAGNVMPMEDGMFQVIDEGIYFFAYGNSPVKYDTEGAVVKPTDIIEERIYYLI